MPIFLGWLPGQPGNLIRRDAAKFLRGQRSLGRRHVPQYRLVRYLTEDCGWAHPLSIKWSKIILKRKKKKG